MIDVKFNIESAVLTGLSTCLHKLQLSSLKKFLPHIICFLHQLQFYLCSVITVLWMCIIHICTYLYLFNVISPVLRI